MFFANFFAFGGFLLGVTCTLLAAILFRFGKLRQHRMMALYNLVIAWWGYWSFLWASLRDPQWAIVVCRISQIAIILIPPLFLHTIFIFCNAERRMKRVLKFAYIQAVFFLVLLPTDLFVPSNTKLNFFLNFMYVPLFEHSVARFVFGSFVFIWGALFVVGHYELYKYLQKAPPLIKGQTFFIFSTWVIVFIAGFSMLVAIPFNITIFPLNTFAVTGNVILAIYYCLMTYIIFKYRFIDLLLVSARLLLSFLVSVWVVGLPLVVAIFGQRELMWVFGGVWWLIPLLTASFTATMGVAFYSYLDKRAQERLLREQREYQAILKNVSSGMIRIRDLDHLLNFIVHLVTKTARISNAAFYLLDPLQNRYDLKAWHGKIASMKLEEYFDTSSDIIVELISAKRPILTEEIVLRLSEEPQNQALMKLLVLLRVLRAVLIIPAFMDSQLTAILILGEKASKAPYTEDDIAVFSVLVNQAALTIENLQFYEQIKGAQEEVAMAEKMATVSTMANCLSHQMGNRLQALALICGISMESMKNFDISCYDENARRMFSELKSALERLESNVLKGSEIVKGLLKYSETGESGFQRVEFKDILKSVLEMIEYKIKREEIEVVEKIYPGLPGLFGNTTQLQEVFFNLLDNAHDAVRLKRKEEGFSDYRGRIEISAVPKGNSVLIEIKDDGIGIKDENKNHVFTPFFTTKATAVKGTGLGLYVIERIIKAHHGTISIHSRHKEGTTVTIVLPAGTPA